VGGNNTDYDANNNDTQDNVNSAVIITYYYYLFIYYYLFAIKTHIIMKYKLTCKNYKNRQDNKAFKQH